LRTLAVTFLNLGSLSGVIVDTIFFLHIGAGSRVRQLVNTRVNIFPGVQAWQTSITARKMFTRV
jgi:hypothetical protein